MKLDAQEQKLGMIWLIAAGIISLLVLLFVFNVDKYLTYNYVENVRKEESNLSSLRLSQFSLGTKEVDKRSELPVKNSSVLDNHKEGHHNHSDHDHSSHGAGVSH